MKRRVNLYKVVDQNGKAVFEDLLTAKQVTEKLGKILQTAGGKNES